MTVGIWREYPFAMILTALWRALPQVFHPAARADTIRVDQLNAFELLNHRFLVIDKASLQSFLDGNAWSIGEGNDDKEAA